MITKLMSYVSVYFIALTNFMMLTLHSLNGVNNTVSWVCSRFRLDKLGSTNVTYILCIYFYLIISHILWKRFKVILQVYRICSSPRLKGRFLWIYKNVENVIPYVCMYIQVLLRCSSESAKNLSGLFLGLNISIRKPTCRVVKTRCERPLTKCLQRFSMTT